MELVSIEENKNNIVVKHQDLVRTARYRLGDTAIKTLSLLISMIKVSDTEFTQYAIKLSDFKELTGANGNEVFKYVDKMTTDLMSKPFWVGNSKLNWVTLAEYQKGDNVVKFEIHRNLKPYFLELQRNFLQYNITNILALKSGFIIRLYELCKDHLSEEQRKKKKCQSVTFDIQIDRLRELFEIPKSYQYSSHIKKRIIDKAVTQFKDKTDIQIKYKEIKLGRKVFSIQITVEENSKGSNDFLQHRQAFINHMRANYVNQDIVRTKDKYTGKDLAISVAQDGKLYDKKGAEFDAERSNEMWDTLFKMAKDNTLQCLNQNTLFDADIEQISTGVSKKANHNHAVKIDKILAVEDLLLTDKFINFAKTTNLVDDEIKDEFLIFISHHKGVGTEPNRGWYKLWCGWISNSNKIWK